MNPNNLPIKYHNTAGCVMFFEEKGEIFTSLIYKSWSADDSGYFMPKGHIEDGESDEEAAIRESIEETGFKDIKIKCFLKEQRISYEWEDGFWHEKTIKWFLAEFNKDNKIEISLTENEIGVQKSVEIFKIDDAISELKYDADKETLKMAKSILEKEK